MKTTLGVDLHKHQLNTVVFDERGAVGERRKLSTKCRRHIVEYFGSSFSSSASINSSPLVPFFPLVLFLFFQIVIYTQTFG